MTWKTLLPTVALALALTTGVAAADPSVLNALISSRASAMVQGGTNAFYAPNINAPAAPVATGWNFYHCGQNGWYFDGTNNWYYVFTQENGALWFELNSVQIGIGLLTACPNGNWQGTYVTNSSTGAFIETGNWWYK